MSFKGLNCAGDHTWSSIWIPKNTISFLTLWPMLSHACAFSPMHLLSHVWIDSLTYALSRMRLFTYESTFSLMDRLSHVCFSSLSLFTCASIFAPMDWLSHLCFLTHAPFHLCISLLTYGLTLSPMLSHACSFSPMNLLSHVWIDSLTYAFSCMLLFTYESTFSLEDLVTHLCFRTHAPFHQWIYFLTYGLTLSLMLSHACAFSPMHLLSHIWIDSLTYAFSRMRLFTYASTFSRMDWLSHLCFLTHAPFHLCIYFLTYGLSLSPMLFHVQCVVMCYCG